jgi:hypothetical protein
LIWYNLIFYIYNFGLIIYRLNGFLKIFFSIKLVIINLSPHHFLKSNINNKLSSELLNEVGYKNVYVAIEKDDIEEQLTGYNLKSIYSDPF